MKELFIVFSPVAFLFDEVKFNEATNAGKMQLMELNYQHFSMSE